MAKRPEFDLASLTAEAAEPMQEAAQRVARPAVPALPPAPRPAKPKMPTESAAPEKAKTADLEPLAFKVAPTFRKRFRQRAHDADLKLNELLFEALDAWEEKHAIKR
jgi:hypothetical protein